MAADAGSPRVTTLAERPDLEPAARSLDTSWPEFVLHDPLLVLVDWVFERFPEYQLLWLDGDRPVARAHSVPVAFDGDPASLPATGWDGALAGAVADAYAGRAPTAVCALEIAISTAWQGKALAGQVLHALRERCRELGHHELVVPLRPSHKHREPWLPMNDYLARTRPDGLPTDPWLRVHVRAGAEIAGVCPRSMTVLAGLAEWRRWTGQPFDTTGPVEVPGALVPVEVSVEQDRALYVEPNVWLRHRLV